MGKQETCILYTEATTKSKIQKKNFLYSLQLINIVINAEILFVYGVVLKVGVV